MNAKQEYLAKCSNSLLETYGAKTIFVKIKSTSVLGLSWFDDLVGQEVEIAGIDFEAIPQLYITKKGDGIPFSCAEFIRWCGEQVVGYRVCRECGVPHYENCGTCFGFGVYSVDLRAGELFPVSANEAMVTKKYRGVVFPCPECGSTVLGLPDQLVDKTESPASS